MSAWFPHRVVPLARAVAVRDRCGRLAVRYRVGRAADYVFTADIYAYRVHTHPERHLGWWRFELPEGCGEAELTFDFRTVDRASVAAFAGGRRLPLVDAWWNPAFLFEPLGDLHLALRDASGRIRAIEPVLLKFGDRDVLRAFYARQYAAEGYRPPDDRPFLHELHAYKLRRLRRLFERYIPTGGRAVDVGCGRSLFADIRERLGAELPFTVVAGDLDIASVTDRAREVPWQRWCVFDAAALPFAAGCFDALFAGEVIEHVPDAAAALREWARVLRPGGIAILTTPNRRRLVARANRMEQPYSADHLSELSFAELWNRLLPEAGFEPIEQDCIYLELCLRGFFRGRGRIEDYLQREGNRPAFVPVMRRLFALGRWAPHLALDLVIVARRRAR
ncbi:MAG TPA: methyltransferase domain-containing protein [Vicinamibacterales bacterium]|nr:methyltransferase domain-containing protein [Vicinamibacterales bacterium]